MRPQHCHPQASEEQTVLSNKRAEWRWNTCKRTFLVEYFESWNTVYLLFNCCTVFWYLIRLQTHGSVPGFTFHHLTCLISFYETAETANETKTNCCHLGCMCVHFTNRPSSGARQLLTNCFVLTHCLLCIVFFFNLINRGHEYNRAYDLFMVWCSGLLFVFCFLIRPTLRAGVNLILMVKTNFGATSTGPVKCRESTSWFNFE